MQERELLELAAKAHGRITFDKTGLADVFLDQDRNLQSWDPLNDDGDALRLAVKLELHITNSNGYAWASVEFHDANEPYGDDPCAATRRAVVRAAAEIGKTK